MYVCIVYIDSFINKLPSLYLHGINNIVPQHITMVVIAVLCPKLPHNSGQYHTKTAPVICLGKAQKLII